MSIVKTLLTVILHATLGYVLSVLTFLHDCEREQGQNKYLQVNYKFMNYVWK
jgi:hypothetical protein